MQDKDIGDILIVQKKDWVEIYLDGKKIYSNYWIGPIQLLKYLGIKRRVKRPWEEE